MNINYGLLPPPETFDDKSPDGKRLKGTERGTAKKKAQSRRALVDLEVWLKVGSKAAAAD